MQNKWEIINKIFISKGLKIFPIRENSKLPCIPKWNEDCSSNFMQILYWYENARGCNWGLPCKENGLFVLDLDRHDENKDGVVFFEKLCKDLDIPNIETLKQETPSGGVHIIFKSDDELENVNGLANAFANYPGIDLRNRNYIVVEPSTINDNGYKFLNSLEPQPMPDKLKKYILENVGTKDENKKVPYEKPKEVFKGDRDNQLFQYINQLYFKTMLDEDEILVLAEYFNSTILEEPFSDKDVKYKVKKAFEKPRGNFLIVRLPDDE